MEIISWMFWIWIEGIAVIMAGFYICLAVDTWATVRKFNRGLRVATIHDRVAFDRSDLWTDLRRAFAPVMVLVTIWPLIGAGLVVGALSNAVMLWEPSAAIDTSRK